MIPDRYRLPPNRVAANQLISSGAAPALDLQLEQQRMELVDLRNQLGTQLGGGPGDQYGGPGPGEQYGGPGPEYGGPGPEYGGPGPEYGGPGPEYGGPGAEYGSGEYGQPAGERCKSAQDSPAQRPASYTGDLRVGRR